MAILLFVHFCHSSFHFVIFRNACRSAFSSASTSTPFFFVEYQGTHSSNHAQDFLSVIYLFTGSFSLTQRVAIEKPNVGFDPIFSPLRACLVKDDI
jgi:hypothetical protein